MSFGHTMRGRRLLTTVAITTGLLVTVAGCGGGGDEEKKTTSSAPAKSDSDGKEEPEASQSDTPLAEVKGEGGVTLTVSSADRDEGGFVTVQGTVTNGTGRAWSVGDWRGDERELASNGGSMAGASLID